MMWLIFNIAVALLFYIDLGILNKNAHEVSVKESALWCVFWISIALAFDGWIFSRMGHAKAIEFLTAYIIEYSLSMDNMFVFVLIFEYFNVPRIYQPRVLRWGILGAVIMRFILIFTGISLLNAFHWIFYLFGAILVFTGVKMAFQKDAKIEPEKNPVLMLFKRFLPFAEKYDGQNFFIKSGGAVCATPLFATLLVIEASDLVFAIDSIPAVLAICRDNFIVYTSNVFAIMGLRALYFLLSGIMHYFRFLKLGISVILCYVGIKMLLMDFYKIPVVSSLMIITGILAVSILASVFYRESAGRE